jgi:vacuolar protein sorting-associated protein 13A/C
LSRSQDLTEFQDLEKKLSYEDIRFYRSIAKSALRKNAEARRKLEAEKEAAAPAPAVGWLGWAFGSHKAPSTIAPEDISADSEQMTDADRRGLLSLVGYNPDADQESVSPDLPQGALKMRVTAKLKTGSFALRQDPHGKALDIVSVVWDAFQADVVQLSGSFDATITLGGFRIHDGTTADSVYPKIVRVKDEETEVEEGADENPFFSLRFEQNPLDGRADNAMTVKMRHLEIVYHKGYVESVVKFFKPPGQTLLTSAHPGSPF